MIKFWLISLLIVPGFYCYGQSGSFNSKATKAIQSVDSVYIIENLTPTPDEYDFINSENVKLEMLFMNSLKSMIRTKPDEFRQSRTLNILTDLATDAWKGSQYADKKKWQKLSKYFHRAADRCTAHFNFMKEISFRIPMVDNYQRRFYYDRRGTEWDLNLYSGKKPKGILSESEKEEIERIPLKFFSEQELVNRFMKEIKRNAIKSDLAKGLYSYAGISVEVDKNTLYKNRIPTARVVVVLGARRLKNVKVKLKEDAT